MGQGSYTICEWDSIQKNNVDFQRAIQSLDERIIAKCSLDWGRKFNFKQTLTPAEGFFGRVPILPALFDDHNEVALTTASWRQSYTTVGHQMVLQGVGNGEIIPEDFKIAWIGLGFPNKQQHFSEFRWQTSDRKFGRINMEEMHAYNKPAVIFDEGLILNEEESFHLYGFLEGGHGYGPGGDLPTDNTFITSVFQSVVPLGATYFKVISRLLGNCGAAIPA